MLYYYDNNGPKIPINIAEFMSFYLIFCETQSVPLTKAFVTH